MPLHVDILLRIKAPAAAPMLNVNYFATPATKLILVLFGEIIKYS